MTIISIVLQTQLVTVPIDLLLALELVWILLNFKWIAQISGFQDIVQKIWTCLDDCGNVTIATCRFILRMEWCLMFF